MLKFDFTGKTAVLTGGASGMGLLTAKRFVEMGGSVVLADINKEALDSAIAEVNAIRNDSAVGTVCDVREYSQLEALCKLANDTFGSIDLAVPFAGGAEHRVLNSRIKELSPATWEFPDIPIEIYDWSLEVNLRHQLYLAHIALRYMREQKSGVIINIGSITGHEGCQSNVGYSAAKSAAMNGLTKSIALYGAQYGVRCCCVAPGPVLTRANMANMKTLEGRAAEPQELVDFILYLASDEGSFFDGVSFLMDGGRSIMVKD